MIGMWWWIWIGFMFLFFVSPVSYGWGYRGWGPPYPSYVQERRRQAASSRPAPPFDHLAWGRGGDFVWGALLLGIVLAIIVFAWPLR